MRFKLFLSLFIAAITIVSFGFARAENIIDTTPPVITLIGEETVFYLEGEQYAEEGARVTDETDGYLGQINGVLTISGDLIDTPYAGEYLVVGGLDGTNFTGDLFIPEKEGGFESRGQWTYSWGLLNGNYYVNTGVLYHNEEAKHLFFFYFHGDEIRGTILKVSSNEFIGSFIMKNPGIGAEVNSNISITSGMVDTSKPGIHYVRYSANDSSGNAAEEVVRTVIVQPLDGEPFESPEDVSDEVDDTESIGTDDSSDISQVYVAEDEATDTELADRLEGRIVLQIEDHGEAWYVHERRRYYLPDGIAAYELMRSLSLGISDRDIALIPSAGDTDSVLGAANVCVSNTLANRLKGRILLQVEQRGEAWYVHPENCHRIYMPDGDAAYTIMRFLSIGITNSDLGRIPE